MQAQHGKTLGEHKERLDGQGETLAQHEKVLGEQTERLDGQGEILTGHERVLGEHTKRLDERDKFAEEQAILVSYGENILIAVVELIVVISGYGRCNIHQTFCRDYFLTFLISGMFLLITSIAIQLM